MLLRSLHIGLGWAVVLSNAAVGFWALGAHKVESLRGRPLWAATAVAQVLVGLQVILGVIAMQVNNVEVQGVHLFYGFIALFFVAILYSYGKQIDNWRYLLYGLGSLFLMGLALRSMFIPSVVGS